MNDKEYQVKKANKEFYDIVESSYEQIDGRRSEELIRYVADQLELIASKTDREYVLDLGCGSGFVSRIAGELFKHRVAIDISSGILHSIEDGSLYKVTSDSDYIPIKNGSLDCVVTFAVLHHCYSFDKILPEVFRVLKKGGVFYSDHDMDVSFYTRFKFLLGLYRKINDAKKYYTSKFAQLTDDMYNCSEYHQNGIPSGEIKKMLHNIGFSDVRFDYHWFGLSPLTNKIFDQKCYKKGNAPLVRIIAIK